MQVIKQKLKGIMAWINQRSHSQSSETNPVSAEVQDKDNEDYDNNYDNVCIASVFITDTIHYSFHFSLNQEWKLKHGTIMIWNVGKQK